MSTQTNHRESLSMLPNRWEEDLLSVGQGRRGGGKTTSRRGGHEKGSQGALRHLCLQISRWTLMTLTTREEVTIQAWRSQDLAHPLTLLSKPINESRESKAITAINVITRRYISEISCIMTLIYVPENLDMPKFAITYLNLSYH